MIPAITNSRAIERQAVADLFRKAQPGSTVTYASMSEVLGADATGLRHIIASARDDVQEDDGIVFEAVPNVGLRRMTELEIAVAVPGRRRKKVHRQAIKGLKELSTIRDHATLPPGERTQMQAGMSLLGAIAAVSTHRAAAKVMGAMTPATNSLPVSDTLAALRDVK